VSPDAGNSSSLLSRRSQHKEGARKLTFSISPSEENGDWALVVIKKKSYLSLKKKLLLLLLKEQAQTYR
jgi:hypothetical protein